MAKPSLAIIGAGPYGLSAAAHLMAAGVEPMIFGEPMEFWRSRMPEGMFLRSAWYASNISDPRGELSLEKYEQTTGVRISLPIPRTDFANYGVWFQGQAAPNLKRQRVTRVERAGSGFRVMLENSEQCHVNRVIVAGGIGPFAYRPPIFNSTLSSEPSITHSSEHRSFANFNGKTVMVIGGGQSALESAALLSEAGARVELLVKKSQIRWLSKGAHLRRHLTRLSHLVHGWSDVGPPILTQLVSRPGLLKLFPSRVRNRINDRAIRPAGASWLRTRLAQVHINTGREVARVDKLDGRLKLSLRDGNCRTVDHVVLATGYRVDVSRYDFLPPDLLAAIHRVNGYPTLGPGFESSLPGLHFLGAPSAWSFGPLTRFVSGTDYTARTLTRHIVRMKDFVQH